MRKTWLAFALAVLLAVNLSACGQPEPETGIQFYEKSEEAVTLSMFVPVGVDLGGTDSFRDLTLTYNERHSNVQISVDSVSTADGFDLFLEERLDAGKAVDIFVVNAENVKEIARKKQFYDLSGLDSFQKLTKSAKEQAMVDGTAYTIPLKMAVYVMDVNVSLLKRHGLAVPQDYDSFVHCCQVLKEQGVTPIALNRWWSMAVPVMARSLYPVYQAPNQEELIEGLNRGELKIGDYMIDGFRMFEMFVEKGYYGEDLVMEEVDAIKANTQDRDDFHNGRAAFFFYPMENLNGRTMENGDECISVGIPMLPDGVVTLPSISVRLCVNPDSDYLEESVEFADYLASERVKLLAGDDSGDLSPFHQKSAQRRNGSSRYWNF